MRLITPRGVGFVPLRGRLGYPSHSVTLIAKVTLALEHGGTCRLLEGDERSVPTGDQPYSEDALGLGAPRYDSDFAYCKPQADVLVAGHFHAPQGKPVKVGEVAVSVGANKLRIAVVGRRRWFGAGPVPGPESAEPFSTLELRWEHAFGGEGHPLNPVGMGYLAPQSLGALLKTRDFAREPLELPRLESFNRLVTQLEAVNHPVCFAPRARTWPVRREFVGTCDERWERTRWPWFPADFDDRHFQAALPDLQVLGYLRGDETLRMLNMHPEIREFETRLPGLRAVAAVQRVPQGAGGTRWTEAVPMQLDTLFIDMDTLSANLVWRGQCVTSDAEASDLAYAWVDVQAFEGELAPEDIVQRAEAGILADEAAWEITDEPAPESEPPAPEPEPEADAEPELDPELAAILAKLPKPTPIEAPLLSPEQQAQIDAAAAKAEAELEAKLREQEEEQEREERARAEPVWSRERVRDARATGQSLAGVDLSGLDLTGEDFSQADLTGTLFKAARLDGAKFCGATLNGASLEGASLEQVDFSDASLEDADLTASHGKQLTLQRTRLNRANLSGCAWRGVSFVEVHLELAVAAGANFEGASFDACALSEADFERASLRQCACRATPATGARFVGADLTQAVFEAAVLSEADFSDATLMLATFSECALDDVLLDGVQAEGVTLTKCQVARLRASKADLTAAQLSRLEGEDCVLDGVRLDRATLSDCKLSGADFSEASLQQVQMSGCVLRGAKFGQANLTGGVILGCDCFESSFEGACLQHCDGSYSSFFRTEFLDADVASFHGAQRDLTGSKLAPKKG